MKPVGSPDSKLIILRGNSASGKTTTAWRIRELHNEPIAIVSQDVLRRDILKVKDLLGNHSGGLIDLTARYALDCGFHCIVEGILFSDTHAGMLTDLMQDHGGQTACFYWDLTLVETVRRHATKPQSGEYGEDQLSAWYRKRDLIPALDEHVFDASIDQDAAVREIMRTVGW